MPTRGVLSEAAGLYSREREQALLQNMSDRAVKERVIGAIVLVVFAVLVVPVFLDGKSDQQETVSAAVTLPGQNNQDRIQQTIVLDRNRTEPVPASHSPTPAPTEKVDVSETLTKAPETPPAQKPAAAAQTSDAPTPVRTEAGSAATSTTGMWAVQLGSFSNQENAERLAAGLRGQGYAAFLSRLETDSGALHRVRIGPQKNRESAEAIAAQLGKSGHNGQVVPHP